MGPVIVLTDAVVSRGYNGAPAIRYFENDAGASMSVGCSAYAKNAPNNTKWLNFYVLFPQEMVARLKRMKLKEHSHINLVGEYDLWDRVDKSTGEIRPTPSIRAFRIEYARNTVRGSNEADTETDDRNRKDEQPLSPEQLPNFMGFEPLGGTNPYFSPMGDGQQHEEENAS